MIEDDLIKEAWESVVEYRPDTVPSEKEVQQTLFFTKDFPEEQTKDLPKRFLYISGRTVSKFCLFILIVALLASTVTVYAVVRLLRLHINDKNTDVSVIMEDAEATGIENKYYPFYLPSRFYFEEENVTGNSIIIRYTDGYSNIYFRQELPTSEGSFDNENTNESLFMINGKEAVYTEKCDEKTLIFAEFGYVFYIDSNSENVSKEQLIKIAESIERNK